MRDWMDEHLPWWVLGVIDWPKYRLISRCWPCGRLMALHTPWAKFVCERTPMPITITDAGMDLMRAPVPLAVALADLPSTDWQLVGDAVVPVSHAGSA
jgi:hypothetical protein